jgi:hypothetical protein
MESNRHPTFKSLAERWLALHPDPEHKENKNKSVDLEAVTSDEVFRTIQYLDPDPEYLGITEDEEIFLAIQDLDPDFNRNWHAGTL